MTISFTKYIDITSSVAGTSQVTGRSFRGRIYTANPLVPAQTFITVDSPADALNYFGSSSVEYARSVFYFGWISKNGTAAKPLDFARWVDVDSAPTIYGNIQSQLIATYQAISNGSFGLTIGANAQTFTGLDFSAVVTLANVASVIQVAINAVISDPQFASATVSFDALRGSFNFVGGDAVDAVISVQPGVLGTPIAGLIGWLGGAILSNGSLAETVTKVLTDSYNASNNFGSFLFIPELTLDEETEAAQFTNDLNVRIMYCARVITTSDATTYFNALNEYGGYGLTYSPISTQYPEQVPMMIFAATDYTANNAVQNYSFQQFNLTPSVSDDTIKNQLDQIKTNYYGVTQQAGQQIAFYQIGALFGLATSPAYMNLYANEIWLKDAIGVVIMNLLLVMPEVSADAQGQSQIQAVVQSVVNQALNNGTISVGKDLTTVQKLYITEITGDSNAWRQVQNQGYWLNVVIVSFISNSGATQYKAVYTLIYSKDDTIQSVNGSDILI